MGFPALINIPDWNQNLYNDLSYLIFLVSQKNMCLPASFSPQHLALLIYRIFPLVLLKLCLHQVWNQSFRYQMLMSYELQNLGH